MVKVRRIRIEGDTAFVPLTMGKEAVIDAADVPLVAGRNWCAEKATDTFYAVRTQKVGGKARHFRLHRVLTGATGRDHVDHVDGNGLNCRRSNMRLATHTENMRNSRRRRDNSSGVKGVTFDKWTGRWQAKISVDGRTVHLGRFSSIEAAAEAYRKGSEKYHGEFGRFG